MNLKEIIWTDPWLTGAGRAGIQVEAVSAITADTDQVTLKWTCWAQNSPGGDSYVWYSIYTATASSNWPANTHMTRVVAPSGSGAQSFVAASWHIRAPLRYPGEAASTVTAQANVQNSSDWDSTNFLSVGGTITLPSRPYHAPLAPDISIDGGHIYISGNQNNPAADRYWSATHWGLETDGVYQQLPDQAGSATFATFAVAADRRYRGFAAAGNANAGGPSSITGYYYAPMTAPGQPVTSRALNSTTVNVSWAAGASPVYTRTYLLERSLNGGGWAQIASTTGTAFADTVAVGSTAAYRVRAQSPADVNQATSGYSAASAVSQSGEHWAAPSAPAVGLALTGAATATLAISGNQNNRSADRYWQYVDWQLSTNGGAFTGGAQGLAGTTTSVGMTGLAANSKYVVQARSRNTEGGASAYAQAAAIYTKPSPVSTFSAARASSISTTVLLTWTDQAAWIGQRLIERSLDNGATWSQIIATTAASATTEQAQNQTALYRMRVVTPTGSQYSDYSATESVGVAYVSNKASMKQGTNQVDRIYVGTQRIRRVYRGTTNLWEDGDG